jgi:hypothetical protein
VGHPLADPSNPVQTFICPAGITSATLCVSTPGGSPDNPHARLPALTGLSHHSPALRELQLLISGRSAYEAVTEAMGGVQQLDCLQELTLHFVVSTTPKKGMWPMFFSDNMQLGKLRRLVVQGSSMPSLAVSVSGSSCRACRNFLHSECGNKMQPMTQQPPGASIHSTTCSLASWQGCGAGLKHAKPGSVGEWQQLHALAGKQANDQAAAWCKHTLQNQQLWHKYHSTYFRQQLQAPVQMDQRSRTDSTTPMLWL